ncbi:hypothetical protein P8891_06050 [Bacillus atrophaeus]|uniref:homing endonuclease associated repeat-containing protein n=1 Tax=Bacillus atrophaeus TaxID=1452 RepID=UPI0022803A77|nr:hypothetical protein [Bacillus atrophaeus]MCY7948680.1 hypothetical protein [Bacillus atrophaeus]MCY8098381.1 hypothetical protein [Bacillus atrophaeus]MCY9169920.1 hypothetical protein [Bacillus atrophaeus]MEC0740645.1 hypothetical protein [Bacillus atrophaeus]MEC0747091.1 hypothetical protein [Bacillus atrophaeus]
MAYTKDELIEILQKLAKDLGRTPKFHEVSQRQSIISYFGSFNKGLEAAGLTVNAIRTPYKYTREELIQILLEAEKELGRPPKAREVKQYYAIRNHFGSFNKALEIAGIKPVVNRTAYRYTKEQLIEVIQKAEKELGRPPRSREISQRGAIINCFGSYKKGLEAAGVAEEEGLTEEQLIDILQTAARKFGRTPREVDIPEYQRIIKHFGSYNAGVRAAGLPVNRKSKFD